LDIETHGPGKDGALNPRRGTIRLLSLATEGGTWVVDCGEVDPRPLFDLLALKRLVGHNLLFDLGFLRHHFNFIPGEVECTMLLARLLSASATQRPRGYHSLEEVAKRELGTQLDKQQQKSNWAGALSAAQLDYAARDAAILLPLHDRLREQVEAAGL